jgi:hypothetical protein
VRGRIEIQSRKCRQKTNKNHENPIAPELQADLSADAPFQREQENAMEAI